MSGHIDVVMSLLAFANAVFCGLQSALYVTSKRPSTLGFAVFSGLMAIMAAVWSA